MESYLLRVKSEETVQEELLINNGKKIETQETLKEKLEQSIEKIIKLYYQMEEAIFTHGEIPEELTKKLVSLKEAHSTYKRALGLENPTQIDLPEYFVEEYSSLLNRAENVIANSNKQIEKLTDTNGAELFLKESKRRVQILITLTFHYKQALGLI